MLLRSSFVLALLLAVTAAQAPATPLAVKGLPAGAPLVVAASNDASSLRIEVDLKDGWHLYGRDVGGGQPVTVRVTGGAFAAAGDLVTPMDEHGLITGRAELRLPLQRTGAGDTLQATMSFMVCDALQCLPPIALELTNGQDPATPVRVLLVAVDESERTGRITRFLEDRGFVPTTTTYAKVTAALCDSHDVVLADSPTWGQMRGKEIDGRSFPATSSPVVAVGMLGTELLEAHKVAMACGYI